MRWTYLKSFTLLSPFPTCGNTVALKPCARVTKGIPSAYAKFRSHCKDWYVWNIVTYCQKYQLIFGASRSTPGGDKTYAPNAIVVGIQFSTTFIRSIFPLNIYFWPCWALKWINFLVSVHNNISNMELFGAP